MALKKEQSPRSYPGIWIPQQYLILECVILAGCFENITFNERQDLLSHKCQSWREGNWSFVKIFSFTKNNGIIYIQLSINIFTNFTEIPYVQYK